MNSLIPKFCYYAFGLKLPFYANYLVPGFIFFKPISSFFKNRSFRLLFIILPSILIFLNLIKNWYFLSDDFDHFVVVNRYTFGELFVKGLAGENIWWFHRLFVGFWLFKILHILFGTNFEAFLTFNFLLHMFNVYLFYLLLGKIARSEAIRVFVSFLFSFFFLPWISNIHEIVALTFFLLAFLILFKWFLEGMSKKYYFYASLLFYFLGVSSKEVVFVFPATFTLFLFFYNSYVKKVNLKKILIGLIPFFLIFVVYLLIFAVSSSTFTDLDKESGYKAPLSFSLYLTHVSRYLSDRIPIFPATPTGLGILVAFLALFDYRKRKLITLPLLVSYLFLISPPALLNKFAPYYGYIPSIFIYLLAFVLVEEGYLLIKRTKNTSLSNLFKVIFFVTISFSVFKIGTPLLDNCFLVQYPRENPRRTAVYYVRGTVEEKLDEVEEKGKAIIVFDKDLVSPEAEWFLGNNYVKYFVGDPKALSYSYIYNPDNLSLTVTK